MVEDAGAAELATDANKVGPVEPRTEVVLVEAAVADVDVTTNRKSIHLVQPNHIMLSPFSEDSCSEWDTKLPIYTRFFMGERILSYFLR